MAEIRWTEEAANWLREIHDYIAQDSPSSAAKVATGIYEKVQLLKSFPEMGYIYKSEPEGHIRILLYGHYRIVYLIRGKETVEILGIFHSALDIENYIT
jgi:toxin ParE1/3/4